MLKLAIESKDIVLTRPVLTNAHTQLFGQNKNPLYRNMGMLGHNGFDIACWKGEPIFHCANFVGKAMKHVDSAGGIGVDIVSLEPFEDGAYRKVRYWHMLKHDIPHASIIYPGDYIGPGDSTGASTGHHVHLGFKRCDFLGRGLDKENGYKGGLNFNPFYTNEFAPDVFEKQGKGCRPYYQVISSFIQFRNIQYLSQP